MSLRGGPLLTKCFQFQKTLNFIQGEGQHLQIFLKFKYIQIIRGQGVQPDLDYPINFCIFFLMPLLSKLNNKNDYREDFSVSLSINIFYR